MVGERRVKFDFRMRRREMIILLFSCGDERSDERSDELEKM